MRSILGVVVVGALVMTSCSSGRGGAKTSEEANGNSWTTVSVGSVYETRTVTRLEQPFVHETETTTKQTLVARNEVEASVKIEIVGGSGTSAQDVTIPLRRSEVPPHAGATVTTTDDTCTVPAGTFDCTRTAVEFRQGDVTRLTETWTAKTIPVPLKSVVTNEKMTTTTVLTSVAVRR